VKLIRCNTCEDVVRLVHTKWKTCECGKSGGQYNDDLISATIGGDCEVIGLRNDFFKEQPFSKKRNGKDVIIQGEYLGDNQIHRIKSGKGPKLKMEIKDNGDGTHDIIFKDKREYTVNIKGSDKKPKELKGVTSNTEPSFKDKKVKKESFISIKKIIKEEMEDFEWTNQIDPLENFKEFFYGTGEYESNKKNSPSIYIARDIKWWYNWIHEVEMSHSGFLEDIEQLNDMVHDLVNPIDGSEKYRILAIDVYSYLSPTRNLGGKNYLQDSARTIVDGYETLGLFAKKNNLTLLETLFIFEQFLDKMRHEGKPLHKN
jgi:hypothetical protein